MVISSTRVTGEKVGTTFEAKVTPRKKVAKQSRNPDATQKRILDGAKFEFAKHGLGGARIDAIAARAKSNKRMLYHYFGNKEALFRITLEHAYGAFRVAEAELELEKDEPITAIRRLVKFTWDYYIANPEFITLVNSENLHKARHIKASAKMKTMSRAFVGRMKNLLERGARDGVFRSDLDPVQVNITIASVGYHYLTNHHTGSIVFERDLMSKQAQADRLDFNTKTILRMICTPQTLLKLEGQK